VQVISAFGRAHCGRYDESSATRLVDIAAAVRDEYGGDLRKLAAHDVKGTVRLIVQLKGIADTGADIFLREMQDVWTWARPYFDKRAVTAVRQLGLPTVLVQEGGYETDPAKYTNLVNTLIEEATERGLYALVDWHQLDPGDPNQNLDLAKRFFTEIAERHKDKFNIIYDIANEPNGVSWAGIKSYAEQMVPVIRAKDPDGVIFVGTHGWASLGVSDGGSGLTCERVRSASRISGLPTPPATRVKVWPRLGLKKTPWPRMPVPVPLLPPPLE